MKTSTIIRLSIFFFIAAFICALILKKLTTKDNDIAITENSTTPTLQDIPQEKKDSHDTVTVKKVKLEVKETPEIDTDLALEQDSFSAELANSWEASKLDQYSEKIEIALSKTNLNNNEQTAFLAMILRESELANINPLLSFVLIKLTSGFQKDLSRNNKIGLLQISDDEAEQISSQQKIKYLGKVTLSHPKVNLRLGLYKFRTILEKNNFDLRASLIEFSETKNPNDYIELVINQIKTAFS